MKIFIKNSIIILSLMLMGVGILFVGQGKNDYDQTIIFSLATDSPIDVNGNTALDALFTSTDGLTPATAHKIEDLTINASLSDSGIYLRNTDRYLVIENCTIIEGGFENGNAGIRLENVSHVTISDCDINNNVIAGIFIANSTMNSIIGCSIYQNAEEGIRIIDSNNTYVSENNICINGNEGISIEGLSCFNVLMNNIIKLNFYSGIFLSIDSTNNTITSNTLSDSFLSSGIIIESNYNSISGNIIENNEYYGIYLLDDASFNSITGNSINRNKFSGILLYFENNWNQITGNFISNNKDFAIMSVFFSHNNTIQSNQLENNGIYLSTYSTDNIIDNSNIINGKKVYYYEEQDYLYIDGDIITDIGQLILFRCDYATVKNLEISNASIGIELVGSNYCNITGNYLYHNKYGIASTRLSNYCNISGNVFSENEYGINMFYSSNNIITSNTIEDSNFADIYLAFLSNYNNISYNQLSGKKYGIYLDNVCKWNNITNNQINDHELHGIYMWYSYENTITDNELIGCSIIVDSTLSNNNIIDTTNTINGDKIYYYEDQIGITIDGTVLTDVGQIILFNCSDFLITNLQLSDTSGGIWLTGGSGNRILDNTIVNSYYGIYLSFVESTTVSGNTLSNNEYGYYSRGSDESVISDNTAMNNNQYGIYLTYMSDENSLSGNKLSNGALFIEKDTALFNISLDQVNYNLINGKKVLFYKDQNNLVIDGNTDTDIGQVILMNCNNSVVRNLNLANVSTGIWIYLCFNNTINNCTITDVDNYGIYMQASDDSTIDYNTITKTDHAMHLFYCDDNDAKYNTLSNNSMGIFLYNSYFNDFSYNNAYNNSKHGLFFELPYLSFKYGASNNTFTNNTCSSNGISGVHISYRCLSNVFINNIFIDNTLNDIEDHGTINRFLNNTESEDVSEIQEDCECDCGLFDLDLLDLLPVFGVVVIITTMWIIIKIKKK